MAENEEPAALEDRVERLETGQNRILSKLDELLGTSSKAHAVAEEHTEKRLDRPSTMEDMVRMELKRAEEEKAKAADAEKDKSERQTIKDNLAKLMETKPEAPQPRRQRVMWGAK